MTAKTQPEDLRERLRRGDTRLFVVPWVNHPVTVNEAHAVVLGLVGAPLGLLATVDPQTAGIIATLLSGYAILGGPTLASLDHDDPAYRHGIGAKTIRHEPWWFIGSLLASMLTTLIIT